MSMITKSTITCGFLPNLPSQPSNRSQTRISLNSCPDFASVSNQGQSLVWGRQKKGHESRRRLILVCSVVEPGAAPPEPPFNFINWILGLALTVALPFFSSKWASLLKLKNEVETAVETAEEIVVAVGKAAEGVEKFAEDIADDLPEGGRLRKVVDFVENVAERASKDAQIVEDFIDKVQEVEEKVEDYVESLAEEAITHEHHKEEEDHRAHEQHNGKENRENENSPNEENYSDETHKH